MPLQVTFSTGASISYLYDMAGTKRQTVHRSSSGSTTTTDYCGSVVYENGVQKSLLTAEGYITLSNSAYYYFVKDHLGNNRVVVNQSGAVQQATHYYPFGASFADGTGADVQRYKYNGKELDSGNGLNLYDYGARMYGPVLAQFTTTDRFAEKYYDFSSYHYGADNPVTNMDINGDSIWFTHQRNDDGELTGVTMHVTGKVLNQSGNNVNMKRAVNAISKSISSTFKGKIKDDKGSNISFTTNIQLDAANSMEEVQNNDHLFVLTNGISYTKDGEISGVSNLHGGKVTFLDADYFTGPYDVMMGSIGRGTGALTAAHEFGHLAGLLHTGRNPFNIMRKGVWNNSIKSSQLQQIYKNWKNGWLNIGPNYENTPLGKKPNRGIMWQFVR